jgi:hypothetical protein
MEIIAVTGWGSGVCVPMLESIGQCRRPEQPKQPSNSDRDRYNWRFVIRSAAALK